MEINIYANKKLGNAKELAVEPDILYSNSNGTSSAIELNANVDNYKYIEIYYYAAFNQTVCNSSKINVPNSNNVFLNLNTIDNDYQQYWYNCQAQVLVSGTSISFVYNGYAQLGPSAIGDFRSSDIIKIYKVLGYK